MYTQSRVTHPTDAIEMYMITDGRHFMGKDGFKKGVVDKVGHIGGCLILGNFSGRVEHNVYPE